MFFTDALNAVELTEATQDDTISLRNLFVEITKEDPAADMEEDIVFAPPENLDDEEDTDDPAVPKQRRLHQRKTLRRRSLPPTLKTQPGGAPKLPTPIETSPLSADFHLRSPATGISPSSPVYPTSSRANRNSTSSFASIEVEPIAVDPFQQRRKRAAKLTKFFGTDYRSLFGEVLESIETGVKDDRHRGSLTEEEAQVRCDALYTVLVVLTAVIGAPPETTQPSRQAKHPHDFNCTLDSYIHTLL